MRSKSKGVKFSITASSRFVSVAQVAEVIPALSQAAIRALIFDRSENGLEAAGAIIKVGRRVVIDLPAFVGWLDTQRIGGRPGQGV